MDVRKRYLANQNNRNGDYVRTPSYEDFMHRNKHDSVYELSHDDDYPKSRKKRMLKCAKWTGISLFAFMLFIFLVIFIILPLVVMWSINVQRFLVFLNVDQPKNPQYNNFALYNATATRNYYVSVNDLRNNSNLISMGVWHLLPEALIEVAEKNETFDYADSLLNSGHDVVVYCHGQIATRIEPLPTYKVLRKYFHVISADYRSYGDSTEAELAEDTVVNDMVQFIKMVRNSTKSKLYVWGHSLGTGICTHVVSELKKDNIIPNGLFLEAPFSTLKDAIPVSFFGKIFSWLPWFGAISDSIESNGFKFESTKNILNVDSPIVIMHAEDDDMIPYYLGKKLADVAIEKRQPHQGNVTYYQFSAKNRYNHAGIYKNPKLSEYIKDFRDVCQEYNKGT